jgi:hypothetical protein
MARFALSRLKHGFESRWDHHFEFIEAFDSVLRDIMDESRLERSKVHCETANGIVKVSVVPFPTADVTQMRPL